MDLRPDGTGVECQSRGASPGPEPDLLGGPTVMVDRTCEQCGVEFKVNVSPSDPPHKGRFCGRACQWKGQTKGRPVPCVQCGAETYRKPSRSHARRFFCCWACRSAWLRENASPTTYIKAPGTGVPEHRAVAEAKLGRALHPGEVVHHIDRNPHNNDPGNLMVMKSASEHAKLHHREDGHPRWGKSEA